MSFFFVVLTQASCLHHSHQPRSAVHFSAGIECLSPAPPLFFELMPLLPRLALPTTHLIATRQERDNQAADHGDVLSATLCHRRLFATRRDHASSQSPPCFILASLLVALTLRRFSVIVASPRRSAWSRRLRHLDEVLCCHLLLTNRRDQASSQPPPCR